MILRWLPITAGALAGALLAGGVQQLRVAHVKGQLSDLRGEYAQRVTDAQVAQIDALQRARAAEQAITDKEKAAQAAVDEIQRGAHEAQVQADVRAAAADDALGRLRQQLGALAGGAGDRDAAGDIASVTRQRDAAIKTIRVLADMRRESAARAVERARFADAAHAAGLICVRADAAMRASIAMGAR